MAQFFTDFSEHTIGQQPTDWSERLDSGGWTVEDENTGEGFPQVNHLYGSFSSSGDYILSWDDPGEPSDVEVIYRSGMIGSSVTPHVIVRGNVDGGELIDGYRIRSSRSVSDEDTIEIISYVDGTFTALGEEPTQVSHDTVDEVVWCRFRANGNELKAKSWEDGNGEPSSWQVEVTDNDISSGSWVAVRNQDSFGEPGDGYVFDFGVGTGGDTAPTSPVPDSDISGAIIDPVQGVTIVAIEQDTSQVYTETTDSNGDYSFSGLDPGTYHVYAEGYDINSKPWVDVS